MSAVDQAATSPSQNPRYLPSDAEKRAISVARKDGFFAGLTSGLASAVIGSHLMRFKRNTTIFCGVLTGILAGALFTKAFTDTAISQLRVEQVRLAAGTNSDAAPSSSSVDPMNY